MELYTVKLNCILVDVLNVLYEGLIKLSVITMEFNI